MTKILTGVDWWWGKFAPRQFREKTEDLIVVRIQPSSGTSVVKNPYGGPTTISSSTFRESFEFARGVPSGEVARLGMG